MFFKSLTGRILILSLLFISAALCFIAEGLQPGEQMVILGWALLGVALLNAAFSFATFAAEAVVAISSVVT